MKPELAIVIPAWNEAATIGPVVAKVSGIGRVIVVDDGSSDNTGEIARASGAEIVVHAKNEGYDRALDSGFRRAAELECGYVITLDADGQHPEEMIAAYLTHLEGGSDLVLGVRARFQRLGERVFAFLTRSVFGIDDPLCGMKGYRMALYRELGHFDSYGSVGTELMLHSVQRGARFVQLPFKTRERRDAPRFGRILLANIKIMRAAGIGIWRFGIAKS
jgi:glycosyltransferase involved in cell wall biosynthesis